MRHKNLNKRFGRNKAQRKQLMRSLVRGLFLSYKIETTVEKAKEVRRLAEKLITLGKKGRLSDIRLIEKVLQDRALTSSIVKKISPLFNEKSSGYTRVIRSGFRRGDGATLAILELTEKPVVEKKPKKKQGKAQAPLEKPPKPKKEAKPIETPPKEEEKKPPKPEVLPPKEEKKPVKEALPTEKIKEEKKPEEEKLTPPKKEGLLGRFKGLFKKGE